jgi:hypothetical protein
MWNLSVATGSERQIVTLRDCAVEPCRGEYSA